VERGRWSGLKFRESPVLRLNAVQLTFSASQGAAHGQEIDVDDLVVRAARP
jgi:hypothetical protein